MAEVLFFVVLAAFMIAVCMVTFRVLFPVTWRKELLITLDENKPRYEAIFVDGQTFHTNSYFSGLEVTLPKTLPHIFLDGHKNNKKTDSRVLFDVKQAIELEGGFDRHFFLFAEPKFASLALSILTPDVMETLLSFAVNFDVEIHKNKLKILTRKGLRRRPVEQGELVAVAKMILIELEHKLSTWNDLGESELKGTELRILDAGVLGTYKLGKKMYIPKILVWLGLFYFVFAGLFWCWGLLLINSSQSHQGYWFLLTGFMFFPIGYLLTRYIVKFSNRLNP